MTARVGRTAANLLFLQNISAWAKRVVVTNMYLVVFADFTDKVAECLVDVDPLLGRGLDELASKVLRKISAL